MPSRVVPIPKRIAQGTKETCNGNNKKVKLASKLRRHPFTTRRAGQTHHLCLAHKPRLMNPVGRDIRQLRNPVPDVVTIEIIVLGLLGDVELIDAST
eukprot:scaffold21186_cov38-Prasinocladus_malaysianus.AAC.1